LDEVNRIEKITGKAFIALVCVDDREICCISAKHLQKHVQERRQAKGHDEHAYTLLVQIPERRSLLIYTNCPGKRGTPLTLVRVPRNRFPGVLFEES